MRFEHLVEVNDVLNPLAAFITRAQLWQGLVLRAEHPELFVPSLGEATILDRTEARLVRVLRYGPGALLVRFVYEDEGSAADAAESEVFDAFRCAAYEEADIATVSTIRRWIEADGHSA